ncbi:MAG: phosphate propanoyltransferase [Candidatus Kerfeldbacteria bacterium]|nr:phosphate propanoyltransferase [Candidatus Kerfeldbacteria bacterium]
MISVVVEVSNRHVHLSQPEFQALFGPDVSLHQLRLISQTPQFAAVETITLQGPKGTIENVRVVGPLRSDTQVELALNDARCLGINPPLRNSGELSGSAGVTLIGPRGTVVLHQGAIIQRRHIHATADDCQRYGLQPDSMVRVRLPGDRGLIFDKVLIKTHPSYTWRLHIDTDEAKAAGIVGNVVGEVLI